MIISKKRFSKMPLVLAMGISTAILLACGGGGSGYESKNDTFDGSELNRSIGGYVVDDLVANAELSLYVLDTTKSDWKGEFLASGSTDAEGRIKDLTLPPFKADSGPFLLVSKGGVMLNGQNPPLNTMSTIVDSNKIVSNEPLFITPLSSFTVEYVKAYYKLDSSNLNNDKSNLFRKRQNELVDRFGLGLIDNNTDLLNGKVIIDDAIKAKVDSSGVSDTKGQGLAAEAFKLRLVNNVILALVDDVKALGAPGSFDEVLAAMAQDQVDGKPDLKVNGELIGAIDVNEQQYFNAITVTPENVATLDVPGGQGAVGDTLKNFASSSEATTYNLVAPTAKEIKAVVPGNDDGKAGCIKGVNSAGEKYPCPSNVAPNITLLPEFFNAVISNDSESVLDTSKVVASDTDKGDTIVVSWVLKSAPSGSACVAGGTECFSDASIAAPAFRADVSGNYIVTYKISDGYVDQEKDVPVKAGTQAEKDQNKSPVITVTGAAREVAGAYIKDFADLSKTSLAMSTDGPTITVVDPESDAMTYAWACHFNRFAYIDDGDSYAGLANEVVAVSGATTLSPTVTTIPFEGVYTCVLTVKDSRGGASTATVKFVFDKSGPTASYMFGIGAIALVLVGLFRRRK